MIRLSDCDKCKNKIGLDPVTKCMICKAFPKEIPLDYVFGEIDVHSIPECNNGIGFEPIEEQNKD